MNRGNHVLRSRRVWTAALATSTFALIAGSAAYVVADEHEEKSTSPHAAASAKALPKPVLDTHHLMELFNQQWYQLVKKELDSGDDVDFKTMHNRGLQAAELANLVAIRDMSDEEGWLDHSLDLQKSGIALANAADTKDAEKTRTAFQHVIQACNDCHGEFGGDHSPELKP